MGEFVLKVVADTDLNGEVVIVILSGAIIDRLNINA